MAEPVARAGADTLPASMRVHGAPGRRSGRHLHLGQHVESQGHHPHPRHDDRALTVHRTGQHEWAADDRIYVPMAFFWVAGLVFGLLGPMQMGVTILTEYRFDAG